MYLGLKSCLWQHGKLQMVFLAKLQFIIEIKPDLWATEIISSDLQPAYSHIKIRKF